MHERVMHEVATPLQLDLDNLEWGEALAENNDSYEEYCRMLEHSTKIAWHTHECSYCKELIHSGDWYQRTVYLSKENGKKKIIIEKKHYPECPKDLRDIEEEMRRERDEEDRAAHREAA